MEIINKIKHLNEKKNLYEFEFQINELKYFEVGFKEKNVNKEDYFSVI